MRTPVRITLRGHEQRGDDLVLIFSVDEGRGELPASVIARPGGRGGTVCFPHWLREDGQPISPVADAALLERASQHVAMLDAGEAWRAMRQRRRV